MGGREEEGEKGREEERWEHSVQFDAVAMNVPCATSKQISKLDAVFVDQCFVQCLLARRVEKRRVSRREERRRKRKRKNKSKSKSKRRSKRKRKKKKKRE